MEGRKPLAKVEGRRRMRLSGVTVAYRGHAEPRRLGGLHRERSRSKKLILADHASERR